MLKKILIIMLFYTTSCFAINCPTKVTCTTDDIQACKPEGDDVKYFAIGSSETRIVPKTYSFTSATVDLENYATGSLPMPDMCTYTYQNPDSGVTKTLTLIAALGTHLTPETLSSWTITGTKATCNIASGRNCSLKETKELLIVPVYPGMVDPRKVVVNGVEFKIGLDGLFTEEAALKYCDKRSPTCSIQIYTSFHDDDMEPKGRTLVGTVVLDTKTLKIQSVTTASNPKDSRYLYSITEMKPFNSVRINRTHLKTP